MAPSDGGTIISSSNRPTVIYLRLTDFNTGTAIFFLVSFIQCKKSNYISTILLDSKIGVKNCLQVDTLNVNNVRRVIISTIISALQNWSKLLFLSIDQKLFTTNFVV